MAITVATQAAEAVGFFGYPDTTLERLTQGESASQTFRKGSFVIQDGGYVSVIVTDNDGDALGIATRAGQNNGTDGAVNSEFIPFVPGLQLEMNLLEASDAAHVLVATDWGTYVQWQTTSSERVLDTTSTTDRFFIVKIALGAAGDTYGKGGLADSNVRVLCVPLGSMMAVSPDV